MTFNLIDYANIRTDAELFISSYIYIYTYIYMCVSMHVNETNADIRVV